MKYKRLLATCSLIPTLASSMFCYSAAQVSAAAPESIIYNTLETNAEKELYDSLYDECLEINGSESDFERTDFCSYDVSLSASRVKEVVWLFVFDHPEFFWLDGSLKRSLTSDSASVSLGILDDYKSGQERNKAKQKLYNAEKVYLDKADTYSTDYEKVKYFHDTLIKNVEYTENEIDQSAISALVNNKTVCAGYTKAFKLLCDDSGIDCIAVQGYSHSWNKCYIDGNWYNVDVTIDDQRNMSYFFF